MKKTFRLTYKVDIKNWECVERSKSGWMYLTTSGQVVMYKTKANVNFNSYRNLMRVIKKNFKDAEIKFCCKICERMAKTGIWDGKE
jgi:hypothetical protein